MDGLLDAIPVAVVVVDEGVIVEWNQAAELLYGHDRAATVGRAFVDVLIEPVDGPHIAARLAAARRGEEWAGDFRVCRRDGVLLVSEFRLAPLGGGRAAWLALDRLDQALAEGERAVLLSAEHAARATAEEALALLEAVLAAAPVGIAVLEPSLRFTRVNDALAAINGMDAASHLGRDFDEVVSMPPEVTADLRRVLTTGRTIVGREVSGTTPAQAGVLRHFVVNSYPVRDGAGAIAGVGITVIEITDRKRADAERMELLAWAEEAQHRLAVLATAGSVMASTMDVGSLIQRLVRVLAPAVADLCVIELIDPTGMIEDVAVAHADPLVAEELRAAILTGPRELAARVPIAEVAATRRARLYRGEQLDAALASTALAPGGEEDNHGPALSVAILVPIEARGVVLGVLGLGVAAGRDLSDDDLELAIELAHRAALALSNAKAFAQEQRIAETLQRALLPSALPKVAGADIAVRYLAAAAGVDIGGDWYDVIPLTPTCVGLVIGDVVGHDVRAASAMAQVRNALRAFVVDGSFDPVEAMARTDRLMDRLGLTLATGVLVVADVEHRTLTWCNAGHPSPLLISGAGVEYLEEGRRVLLGAGWASSAAGGTHRLAPGDTVVLYTDGLIERRGESIGVGLERLTRAARSSSGGGVEELGDHLLAELVPGDDERDDDVALLVARFA